MKDQSNIIVRKMERHEIPILVEHRLFYLAELQGEHPESGKNQLKKDLESYFETIDHAWLIKFLEHRIGDNRILRLIRKWLHAGVVEEGVRSTSDVGSPQGSGISPLLSNVFLHYVFDLWIE